MANDRIFLTYTFSEDTSGDPVRISFPAAAVTPGQLTEFSCGCQLDVGPFLASRSFSKSELLGARVTAVTVKSIFPIGQRLDYLDRAVVLVSASGTGNVVVAESNNFPASQQTPITAITANSVLNILNRPAFSVLMRIDPTQVEAGKNYELELQITVELDLEGI